MRVPLRWLREFVDVEVDAQELADRLSNTGSAVDKIERFAPGVSGVVVARVLEVHDVPESDRLCVAQVDAGDKDRVQVLAGAKNFEAGDIVALALPGARVTTLDVPVSVRPMLKGAYESQGMLCSAKELGVAEDHAGILVLPPDTPLGADVAELLGLDDDVLEFEIYPNRPDQMSVLGIAREVSVVYDTPLRLPAADVLEAGPSASSLTSVAVEDAVGCPRYLARVIENVRFGPSPALVQARLTACGFRPLGNLVDATNYTLLLTGQPLHAFDLDRLAEQRIVVRRANEGETLKTIDGEVRKLFPEDLVIADANAAQAIAGVMGGEEAEVGERTSRVLLESAHFDAISISRTARRHHMRTEASARFERGSDPEAVPTAAAMAAECIRLWAGGVVVSGAVDVGGAPERCVVPLRPARVEKILGVTVAPDERDRFLRGLGCAVEESDDALSVVVPSWRPDLEREIDLIEEIGRLHGYDKIESVHRAGRRGGRSVPQRLRERARDVLLGAGLSEATLSSFVNADDLAAIGYDGALVHVSNPLTEEQRQLRPNLFAGLLRAAQRNTARGVQDVRLFEFGSVFRGWSDDAELPKEEEHVGFVLTGVGAGEHWSVEDRRADAFDAKGIVELVLAELGVGAWEPRAAGDVPFHPGRAANIVVDGGVVGRFGEVRPSVARAFDLEGAVLGGLALAPLFARAPERWTVSALPTQPPGLRDIAMSIGDDVTVGDLLETIRSAGGELLESVMLVDEYRGDQVGAGKRSLAFRLVFRVPDRTLTSAEVDAAREAIAGACRERHGAEIR
jgi:phenylalanyl-tRNA synthetase beta chain